MDKIGVLLHVNKMIALSFHGSILNIGYLKEKGVKYKLDKRVIMQ